MNESDKPGKYDKCCRALRNVQVCLGGVRRAYPDLRVGESLMALPLPDDSKSLVLQTAYGIPHMTTDDRERKGQREASRERLVRPRHPSTETDFIDAPHGRHGGSEESEGRPQSRDEPAAADATTSVDDAEDLQ